MFGLSKELELLGHTVRFWGMEDKRNIVVDDLDCFAPNIDYHGLGPMSKILAATSTIYSRSNQQRVATILDEFKPDIVHLHNFNFQLTTSILSEIKKRSIGTVYTAHDSQIVCPYHRLYNFQKKSQCVKCVEGSFLNCIRDKCFDDSILRSAIGSAESFFAHSRNIYNESIDTIISPSQFLADLISKRYRGKIKVIPNFVSDLRAASGEQEKADYVLYFGRISEEKGILEIIDTFEKLGNKLLLVGGGAVDRNFDNYQYVSHLGPLYGQELYRLVREASFVVQPAKWFENCPMTVIESFSCGTPVIASKHSGFLELITDGIDGCLIDFARPDFSTFLARALKMDAIAMGAEARRTYESRYTVDSHISRIIEVYKEVVDGIR